MSEEKKTAVIKKLNDSLAALNGFVASLDEAQLKTAVYNSESEDAWTVRDMLVHVIDAKKGMGAMAANWRKGRDPIPRNFDVNRWNAENIAQSKERTVATLLADYEENHARLLGLIDKLEDGDWEKRGWHAAGQEMSVEQVLHLIADHETSHLDEIRAALKPAN